MAGRRLAHTIDADMACLDQRGGAGAGFDHPRVPQPFIETLSLQRSGPDRAFARSIPVEWIDFRSPLPEG